ncbi:hypothetical protein B7P43_G17873 [Cryptotermes secundus]|nr:hypothetical protein B7P43_G17873 [Cryptotermes secundus]
MKKYEYVYFDQLQFLSKLYDERETVDSMEQRKEQENEGEESVQMQVQASADVFDVSTPLVTKSTSIPKARKHKKVDEVELRILKALEGDKPCSKMAFLQSLMPHLQKFDNEEFLQFQMEVLKVIGNINEKKKTIYTHPPYFSQQLPTFPQPHFVHPSSATECQSQQYFNASNQHPFYREQVNMHGQTSSTYAQMPIPNQSQPSTIGKKQAPLLQEISSHSSGGSKQPSPVSRYFSEFTSPESEENSLSLTSAASSIADSIDFGTSN